VSQRANRTKATPRLAAVTWLLVVVFVLVWAGSALLIDAYLIWRRREPLAARLGRHRELMFRWEVEEWLRQR
jgi:hypothetical protein